MADLILAFCFMALFCAVMTFVGQRIGSRISSPARLWLVLAGVAWISVFSLLPFDSVYVLFVLPVTAVSIYGNWVAPAGCFVAGVLWRHQAIPKWRRIIFSVALVFFTFKDLPAPVFARAPFCDDLWEGSVCRQTSDSTCSAAAAATLLGHFGIEASEGEMAQLCRSNHIGTSLHGLYRGLRIKTDGAGRRVIFVSGKFQNLGESIRLPVLVNVTLDRATAEREPRYVTEWGWTVGRKQPWFSTAFQIRKPRLTSEIPAQAVNNGTHGH